MMMMHPYPAHAQGLGYPYAAAAYGTAYNNYSGVAPYPAAYGAAGYAGPYPAAYAAGAYPAAYGGAAYPAAYASGYAGAYAGQLTPQDAARRMVMACTQQRWHVAQALLSLYEDMLVDVRGIGTLDATPLHAAAAAGQTDLMLALLDAGADVDAPALHGYTPLHLAARANRPNATRLLLQAGADPDAPAAASGTPLLAAVDRGHLQVVQILLDAGAATFARNPAGDEPLHLAACRGHIEIAQALLDAGADLNTPGARGLPAHALAFEAGFPDLGEMLRTGVIPAQLRLEYPAGAVVPYAGAGAYNSGALVPYAGAGGYSPYGPYGGYGPGYTGAYHGGRALDLAPYQPMGRELMMYGGGGPYGGYGGGPYGGYGGAYGRYGYGAGFGGMYDPDYYGARGLDLAYPTDMMMYPGAGDVDMMYNRYGLDDFPGYGSHAYGMGYGMPYGSMGGRMGRYNRSLMRGAGGGSLALIRHRMSGPDRFGNGGYGMGSGMGMEYGGYGGGYMDPYDGFGMEPYPYERYGSMGYGGFGGRGRHGRYGRRHRRAGRYAAEEMASAIVESACRGLGMSRSEKRRIWKRIMRNSREARMDMRDIIDGTHSSETTARILLTDGHGSVRRDGLFYNVMDFIRTIRDSGVGQYGPYGDGYGSGGY